MMASLPAARRSNALDGVAVSASLLCLVHCLALPMLATALPVVGLLLAHEEMVHWLLLVLAVPVGLWALGRRRAAAGPWPFRLGVGGFGLMTAAVVMFHDSSLERWLTVIGVTVVAAAHLANWRAARPASTSRPA